MSGTDIAKAYDPKLVEQRWYQAWLDARAFAGVADPAKAPFCIVIPPPNVTGVLTMGHVLNNTIQDILTRRARQEGKAVLWLPGTDHAGLATQSRVERELKKEGLDRRRMGREAFFQRVVEWRDKHGGIIIEQLKRLGCSCDWSRTVHTLDPAYSRAVLTAFVKLYERGYIYRGKRMVNWCPASQTALSDEEVIPKPQKGSLYHMRYEIVERPGEYIQIATTRPETLMGDTAVAVHPDDPRYANLRGAHVWRPFPRAQIPIIFDTAVDKDFGSGALKVTPAHDKVDFEIGQRHHLPIIEVIDAAGKLNELAGEEFMGLERFKARKLAAQKLNELGLLIKEDPYENNVGFSERADVPIEPRLSEQWFLKYPRIEEAKAAVRDGHIKFWPEHWSKVYLNWLDKIQDWCISRQVWWGHRIPVWYKKGADRNDAQNRHVSLDGPPDPQNWEQDEDSLDTWASSWLWPFATMGWPAPDAKQAQELDFWYPTNDLVTGPDIIFFWVARMIIAGLEFMRPGESLDRRIPFKNVYFTGIIRDKQGRKMSKSLGNSPDPLDLIDQYGADGLRFGTMNSAPQGNDILFDETNVELGRNFCNKLWNAARFRQMQGPTEKNGTIDAILNHFDAGIADADDQAILARLAETLDAVARDFAKYEFNTATQNLYAFFWGDFCDWYLEVAKARSGDEGTLKHVRAVQDLCLRQFLLLLHPFMPFITEELWHGLGFGAEGTFIQNAGAGTGAELLAKLATVGFKPDASAAAEIAGLREFVSQARALKAQFNLAARRDLKFALAANPHQAGTLARHGEKLRRLAGAAEVDLLAANREAPAGAAAVITPLGTLYLDLAGAVDKNAERARLAKEIEKLDKVIAGSEAKLANEAFTAKAPANVIEGARKQLADNQAKREELRRLLEALK
ncbi:MAG TPA: valine--tRNA ligase [Opitutales bacterium]|nr:valine--tRNA ligase [Opitutales bacterium]